jgi:hypothetical protein
MVFSGVGFGSSAALAAPAVRSAPSIRAVFARQDMGMSASRDVSKRFSPSSTFRLA